MITSTQVKNRIQKFHSFLYLWIFSTCKLVKVHHMGNGSSLLLICLPKYQGRSIFLSVSWFSPFHFFVTCCFRLSLIFPLCFDISLTGLQALFLLYGYHGKWFCIGYCFKFLICILVVFLIASLFYLFPRKAIFTLRLSTKNNIF